jgi:SAM-dependent methyltransferase
MKDSEIVGYVDGCDDGTLQGWAASSGSLEPVTVDVSCNGELVGVARAAIFREDLKDAGIGSGRHGFAFAVPAAIRARREYTLDVCEHATATPLTNSPFTVHEDPEHPFQRGGSQLRRFVADQYCVGAGLEIGALHRPFPVPAAARMRYADSFDTETLVRLWSPEVDGQTVVPVDLVTDATTLAGVDDRSFDFVVASHVVEHLEDPIRSVISLLRVVRPGGIVLILLPDRRHTFDANRPATPIAHIVRDYCAGPTWSQRAHFDEWVNIVEGLRGDAARARADALQAQHYPIHFHVWTPMEFTAALADISELSSIPFEIDLVKASPPEAIWALRRILHP